MSQTIAQRRAAHALATIERIQADPSVRSEYLQHVKGLPSTIVMNGLGQASAMLLAKGTDAHKALYRSLNDWLCGDDPEAPYRGKPDLLKAMTSESEALYLRAQAESLAYLDWLKKFACAYLN